MRIKLICGMPVLALLMGGCTTEGGDVATAAPAAAPVALNDPDPEACHERSFSVYFGEWETEVGPEGRTVISAAQEAFAGCVIHHVRIVGLAGAKGDEATNIEVSQKRAEAIADLLAAGGWSRDRFELVAVGEQGATLDNGVAKPMRRAARVEIAAATP
jgi:outer membrane protein OmpA-like peptidoglycan-associated protein